MYVPNTKIKNKITKLYKINYSFSFSGQYNLHEVVSNVNNTIIYNNNIIFL